MIWCGVRTIVDRVGRIQQRQQALVAPFAHLSEGYLIQPVPRAVDARNPILLHNVSVSRTDEGGSF
jgi:hypothetical protein